MNRPSVNLRKVAARAGVSATTASSALRGTGRMTQALRDHVNEIAREIGYRVDPIISAGMAQLRRNPENRIESAIAWIDATPAKDSLENNPVFRLVWKGAAAQAASLGYSLERFWLHNSTISPARLKGVLRARGIEGAVVLQYYQESASTTAPCLDFDFSNLACASVTTRLSNLDMPFAQADQFACTELAMRELCLLGYRRIGLICPPSLDALTQRRISSAHEGFVSHCSDLIRIPILAKQSRNENAVILNWLKVEKPDVVLGWKHPHEFRAMGFNVPEDIGVCLLDYLPDFGDCAGVYQNHEETGAAVVRLVHAQLKQRIRGIPRIVTGTMVEGAWIPGSSLRSVGDSLGHIRHVGQKRPIHYKTSEIDRCSECLNSTKPFERISSAAGLSPKGNQR